MKITTELQLTQTSLTWLFLCQLAVLFTFLSDLPIWLFPVFIFSAAWRYRILKGHWSYPGWQIKGFAVLIGIVGIAMSPINPLSLEAATSLLLLGFSLKNLELTQRRDGILVVYIGYFLVATRFLYSQTLLTMLIAVILMAVLTSSLISLHLSRSHNMRQIFQLSTKMLSLCLPLMLVGYLFFPRLPPLWSVPMPDQKAISGISDSMTPGDIAEIAGSGALAFRATFEGEPPANVDRYWRGPVLSIFNGKTWLPGQDYFHRSLFLPDRIISDQPELFQAQFEVAEKKQSYSVLYEPSYQNWAFSLTPSRVRRGSASSTYDFQVINPQKITTPVRLVMEHYPGAILQPNLPDWVRQESLQLPAGLNTRTFEFVQKMRNQTNTDQELAISILRWFRDQEFYYTLKPPTSLGNDTIDEFLFDSKRGFCAHYASAFAVMMRQAGIPSRIVSGYQGGEWNEQGNFIAVHQFDAHAWVEVWFSNQGWISLDPTAWVAPDRVEKSLREALTEEPFLGGSLYYQVQFSLFNQLRLKLDAMNFQWQRWVLNYDSNDQFYLMTRLLGKVDYARMLWFAGGGLTVLGLFWLSILGLLRPSDTSTIQYRQWQRLIYMLKKKGVKVETSTTPKQLEGKIRSLNTPWSIALSQYLNYLSDNLYKDIAVNKKELKQRFKNVVKQL